MFRINHAVQATALCGVLFLAACGSPQPSRDMYKDQEPVIKQVDDKPKLSAQRLAAIKEHGLDEQTRPARLVGLSERDVTRTLGDPNFVRRDKGVEIWQYKNDDCILDLFLYEEAGRLSVDHTELRGTHMDQHGQLSCFKRIVMGETS